MNEPQTPDLTILVHSPHGVITQDMGWIQSIEKNVDAALVPLGFSRTGTTTGDGFELQYRQFGVCQ